ncbi:hypothetical protein JOF53_007747 [Crossiella equi]|uniref:Uncharacterized protein n=1 Tax=Crossiella equi TaxID=130796 RepID=A0ABS5AQM5_9PSEU|nr:hypothetical protein [Crossiella equi]MBP2478875.1 hypothetical protein [Crossiella equi]
MRTGGTTSRVALARVLSTLTVLVGLLFLQNAVCSADPHVPGCHTLRPIATVLADTCAPTTDLSPGLTSDITAPTAAGFPATTSAPSTEAPLDLLGLCLTLLVAVLLALLASPTRHLLLPVLTQLTTVRLVPQRPHRAPALTQLCISRT